MLYDVGSLTVRVMPRSARPGVEIEGRGVLIRVASPPVDGRATEEARRLLARCIGVPTSAVRLRSGRSSRTKIFEVEGLSQRDLDRRIKGEEESGPSGGC
jgi:uncharacterized protein YggU (UPF0235/DUF167 family)